MRYRPWRFPARDHLRRPDDFRALRRDGRIIRHPVLHLSFRANGLEHNRYGFIISKQIGRAVVRNQLRRRLREIIRLKRETIATGYDVVLIARPEAAGKPYVELVRIIDELLSRSGLLRSSAMQR